DQTIHAWRSEAGEICVVYRLIRQWRIRVSHVAMPHERSGKYLRAAHGIHQLESGCGRDTQFPEIAQVITDSGLLCESWRVALLVYVNGRTVSVRISHGHETHRCRPERSSGISHFNG